MANGDTRPATDGDWTVQAADTIERVVVTVRSKTSEPVVGIARWVVFGLLAAVVGSMALILLAIASVRLLDIAITEAWGPGHVWLAYVVIGGIFAVGGLFLFGKSRPRPSPQER